MDGYSGKKKSGGSAGIVILVVIVVLGGIIFAAGQDWKTGENSIVELIKAQSGDAEALYQQGLKAQAKKGIGNPDDKAIPLFEKGRQCGPCQGDAGPWRYLQQVRDRDGGR